MTRNHNISNNSKRSLKQNNAFTSVNPLSHRAKLSPNVDRWLRRFLVDFYKSRKFITVHKGPSMDLILNQSNPVYAPFL
jgi:hypothetical protein